MNWQSRDDERVARALDGAPPPYERGDRWLLAVAARIRDVAPHGGLDATPGFRDALRARLLAEGTTLLPRPRFPTDSGPDLLPPVLVRPGHGQGPPTRPGARRRHRKVVTAGVLTFAFLWVSTVTATGALTGDPLHGLKRRMQGAETTSAAAGPDRGHRHLELARTRVRELGATGPSAAPGPLAGTLEEMDAETRIGVRLVSTEAVRQADEGGLAELGSWATEQSRLLSGAAVRLPVPVRGRAADSLTLLGEVSARVASLRAVLGCTCPAATAAIDDLGPLPCAGCTGPATTAAPPPAAPSLSTIPPYWPRATGTTVARGPDSAPPPAPSATGIPSSGATARPTQPRASAPRAPAPSTTPAPRPPEQPDPTPIPSSGVSVAPPYPFTGR